MHTVVPNPPWPSIVRPSPVPLSWPPALDDICGHCGERSGRHRADGDNCPSTSDPFDYLDTTFVHLHAPYGADIDPGDGWRRVRHGERIMAGDQCYDGHPPQLHGMWHDANAIHLGARCGVTLVNTWRRRLPDAVATDGAASSPTAVPPPPMPAHVRAMLAAAPAGMVTACFVRAAVPRGWVAPSDMPTPTTVDGWDAWWQALTRAAAPAVLRATTSTTTPAVIRSIARRFDGTITVRCNAERCGTRTESFREVGYADVDVPLHVILQGYNAIVEYLEANITSRDFEVRDTDYSDDGDYDYDGDPTVDSDDPDIDDDALQEEAIRSILESFDPGDGYFLLEGDDTVEVDDEYTAVEDLDDPTWVNVGTDYLGWTHRDMLSSMFVVRRRAAEADHDLLDALAAAFTDDMQSIPPPPPTASPVSAAIASALATPGEDEDDDDDTPIVLSDDTF